MSEATPMPVEPPGPSLPGAGLGCGRGCWAWSHLPGAGHPAGPPAAPPGAAPAGRLGRRDHRGPSGGSDRGQHDLSPAAAWRCWVDDGLWRRWRVADLLGPASPAARGAAGPDLVWLTDRPERTACQVWA